jgi:hypothetical protein
MPSANRKYSPQNRVAARAVAARAYVTHDLFPFAEIWCHTVYWPKLAIATPSCWEIATWEGSKPIPSTEGPCGPGGTGLRRERLPGRILRTDPRRVAWQPQSPRRSRRTRPSHRTAKPARLPVTTLGRTVAAWLGLAVAYHRLRRFDLADCAYHVLVSRVGYTPIVLNNFDFII